MDEAKTPGAPRLRHAAIITVVGYVLGWGVPFASFSILPKLFNPDDAAKTCQNIAAHQGLFSVVIFAFLLNFIGDVVSAWGLYLLLRPVDEAVSMFVASLRVVFATVGLAAVLNLVTAHRLLNRPSALTSLGQTQLQAHVQVAVGSFNSQFAFSLIIFGVYLILLGGLMFRSSHFPKWLAVLMVIDGAGWIAMEGGTYFLPDVDLGFLFAATFGELFLLVWLIGWGTRLKEPAPVRRGR
jgi:hypothetical protein